MDRNQETTINMVFRDRVKRYGDTHHRSASKGINIRTPERGALGPEMLYYHKHGGYYEIS